MAPSAEGIGCIRDCSASPNGVPEREGALRMKQDALTSLSEGDAAGCFRGRICPRFHLSVMRWGVQHVFVSNQGNSAGRDAPSHSANMGHFGPKVFQEQKFVLTYFTGRDKW